MKSIIDAARKNDYESVENLTKNFTDAEYLLFLKTHFSSVEPQIYSHNNSKRKKRDVFFNRLKKFCSYNDLIQSSQYIKNKHDVAIYAEIMYDEIKEVLEQSDISKCSLGEQCWAHIERALKEIAKIKDLSRKLLSEKVKDNQGIFISDKKLIDDKGTEYDADFVIEQAVNALSMTLSMLGHQHGWFTNDGIELPPKPSISEDLLVKSGAIQLFAIAWDKLEDASNRCMIFGGDVKISNGDDVQADARAAGVIRTVNFKPDFSLFERTIFVSSNRNIDANSQVFYDAILNSDVNSLVVSDISEIHNLYDGQFLSEGEATSLLSLSNIYCDDMFVSLSEYKGLTVKEWVRGYACLQYLVGKVKDSSNFLYSREVLVNTFILGGISQDKADLLLSFMLYGRKSRDLYDCPIVKVSSGDYFVFHEIVEDLSIFSTLASQFSNLNVDFKNKGFNFEKTVIEKLEDNNIEVRSFKFKRGLDEYEYDAVFILGNKVFVVECKNRSLSSCNPVRSARYKKFMDDTVYQVQRLVCALKIYPEVFFKEFNQDICDFEIVPLVINCLPFSYPGQYNEVYFSDISSLSMFLKSKNITFKEYKGSGNQVNEHFLYEQWLSDKPTSADLIQHLELPIQLKVYFNSMEKVWQWVPASYDNSFSVIDLSANLQRGMEEEFGVQKFNDLKAETVPEVDIENSSKEGEIKKLKRSMDLKRKSKKNKRKVQRNSRRINRRR
jgi:hypothetical protein